MQTIRPRASRAVRKLARQLTRRAAFGLAVLALAWAAALAACVAGLGQAATAVASLPTAITGVLLAVMGAMAAYRVTTWLSLAAPAAEGVRLTRENAPSLYRLVDRLARRMDAPAVDCIRISADMNAAVHQRPEHGAWGRMQTTLIVGLPLVHSVSPRQLAAILAHEMGHLSRQRCGRGAWGAHLRACWHRVCERIASDDHASAQLLTRLFSRWAENDLMDALRLNHLEEYEADRVAARIVGAKLLGDTLVEVAMKAEFIESDYWDKVMAQAERQPRPSIRPFRDMGMGVAAGFHALPQHGLLHSLVSADAGGLMHPTLTDRLVALRVAPRVPAPGRRSAANFFLRPALSGLSRRFDSLWWRSTRLAWRNHYRQCQTQSDD